MGREEQIGLKDEIQVPGLATGKAVPSLIETENPGRRTGWRGELEEQFWN